VAWAFSMGIVVPDAMTTERTKMVLTLFEPDLSAAALLDLHECETGFYGGCVHLLIRKANVRYIRQALWKINGSQSSLFKLINWQN